MELRHIFTELIGEDPGADDAADADEQHDAGQYRKDQCHELAFRARRFGFLYFFFLFFFDRRLFFNLGLTGFPFGFEGFSR